MHPHSSLHTVLNCKVFLQLYEIMPGLASSSSSQVNPLIAIVNIINLHQLFSQVLIKFVTNVVTVGLQRLILRVILGLMMLFGCCRWWGFSDGNCSVGLKWYNISIAWLQLQITVFVNTGCRIRPIWLHIPPAITKKALFYVIYQYNIQSTNRLWCQFI